MIQTLLISRINHPLPQIHELFADALFEIIFKVIFENSSTMLCKEEKMIVRLQAGDYTALINSERGANCISLRKELKVQCYNFKRAE